MLVTTLTGSASDDGIPSPLVTQWSQAGGPPGVTFADSGALTTTATFPVPGRYTLQLTADDGAGTETDSIEIVVPGPPVVDAGADRVVEVSVGSVSLGGSVVDDGLPDPPGAVMVTWSQIGGPAGVVFADAGSAATVASFPGVGVYDLRLEADDGATVVSDTVRVEVVDGPGRVMVITGNAVNLPSGDRAIIDRLEVAGLEVVLVDDDDELTAADLSGSAAVFVTTSVIPSEVAEVIADAVVPVVTWEPWLYPRLAMATRGGESSVTRRVTIAEPGHPLAGGLSGSPVVYTVDRPLSYGIVGDDATVVAHVPGVPSQAVIFVYDTGDTLIDGTTAPAPRIGLFPSYPGGTRLNSSAIHLIDTAIQLAT